MYVSAFLARQNTWFLRDSYLGVACLCRPFITCSVHSHIYVPQLHSHHNISPHLPASISWHTPDNFKGLKKPKICFVLYLSLMSLISVHVTLTVGRQESAVTCSIANPDPGSGAFLTPGSGIRDPVWVKNQDPDPG